MCQHVLSLKSRNPTYLALCASHSSHPNMSGCSPDMCKLIFHRVHTSQGGKGTLQRLCCCLLSMLVPWKAAYGTLEGYSWRRGSRDLIGLWAIFWQLLLQETSHSAEQSDWARQGDTRSYLMSQQTGWFTEHLFFAVMTQWITYSVYFECFHFLNPYCHITSY